jgi:NAD(P)-dependent dehydrogenase (short-subunit alcohol dehydrogenase family)
MEINEVAALVTGAASGLGAAPATTLAERGATCSGWTCPTRSKRRKTVTSTWRC